MLKIRRWYFNRTIFIKYIRLYISPIVNRKPSLVNFAQKWIHVTRLGRLNYCIIIITDVHISLHATRKCIVIALPKSLVMSFVLLILFGLYFMFCPFFIWFNFPTTFFSKDGYTNLSYFPMRKSLLYLQLQATAYSFNILLLCKKNHSSISWDIFQLCFVCSIILLHNVSLNSKVMESFLEMCRTIIRHIKVTYFTRHYNVSTRLIWLRKS